MNKLRLFKKNHLTQTRGFTLVGFLVMIAIIVTILVTIILRSLNSEHDKLINSVIKQIITHSHNNRLENEINKAQYELIYSTNLTKYEHKAVHSLLKNYFLNFQPDNKRKITYTENGKHYSLEIILVKKKIKIKYKSNKILNNKEKTLIYIINNDPNNKIRTIKSKIEEIKLKIKKNKDI